MIAMWRRCFIILGVLMAFQVLQTNLKQIDKYIWQLGKAYFPKNFGKKNSNS